MLPLALTLFVETIENQAALEAGIVPVIHGDVAFDEELGGTVASTEDLFAFLATKMPPR